GAINTLRKLQQIAGPAVPKRLGAEDSGDPSATAALDSGLVSSNQAEDADTQFSSGSQAGHVAARPVPILAVSESFGRYQIVRLLGRGAMGAVYLAYDSQLQRHVALKTPFLGENPETIKRFYREARSAAQLRSPHICPIYDVGQISGIHYLSMAFIDGQSLGRVMAGGQLKENKAIVEVMKKLARGLQKANEQGIIHRDLKPENIMIDTDGEPIVMDFGLARRVDDDIQVTAPGKLLGTPAYMSPEQVDGDPAKIGPPT